LGAIKGLIQTNLKRIIAYSSFINLSFILLALFYLPVILNNNSFLSRNLNYLIFVDLNNCLNLSLENKIKIASFTIVLFYLIIYVFLNFLFFSFLMLFQKLSYNLSTKEFKSISDLTNLDNTNNFLSYYLVTILLSFIGLPPFCGFFSKYLVLYQFFIYNFKLTSFIFLFFSIISSFYYFKIIKIIYFSKKKNLNHKYSNLILLNNQKYLINYKTNTFLLNLLILINLVFNFGFPFFFVKFLK
jgi:NADH:ubiquinone oxidoreductase subunit 2 (subunit N)